MNTKNFFWLFLFLITVLRVRVASQFGLSVDEAHYVLYGKLLDWSYFDHPPLVGWVQGIFQLLPFDHLIKARLAAILISILTSKLIFNYLITKNISEKNSLYAVIALNLTPMFNTMSVALLPDTLLMPLTLLIIMSTEKILDESSLKNWILMGLWLGLAGLSKYTAVLYVFSLVLIFIFKNKFRELLKVNIWAGILIALALISPVLYWNLKNNWVSFQYQGDHVFTFDSSIIKNWGASFIMQMISWGIGPFLISLIVFLKMLKNIRHEARYFVSLVFLSVFLLFFIYIAMSSPLLPHWMLIYFILMIPLCFTYLLENKKYLKILTASFAISTLLSLALLFELAFKIFPPKYTASLYEGVSGWENIMTEANKKLAPITNPKKALAVMNWTLGSRAMYYNHNDSLVFVIDTRYDQFDIWAPQTNIGYDLIAIIEANKKDEHLTHLNCAQLTAAGDIKTTIKDVPVNHFMYYHCANFLGYK